jgi:hypothetical protein
MSGTSPGYRGVPEVAANDPEHVRRIAQAINNILQGKMNSVTTVTLAANVATTTLTDARISSKSFIGFQPTTANAAAALGTLYTSSQMGGTGTVTGSVVLNHANNAQTDRTFNVLIIG